MDYQTLINTRFPIRNTAAQKESFRQYVLDEAASLGLPVQVEVNQGHSNLILSSPASAKVIFCAHYDTPRRMLVPNLMLPTNALLRNVYRFGLVIPLVVIALAAARLIATALDLNTELFRDRLIMIGLYLGIYLILAQLLFRGAPNRHNANDNTSGTAAVLTLARKLHSHPDIAFILFDDEEKGKKGSKAFVAAHPDVKREKLIVNLDCVGNGDHFICAVPEKAKSFMDSLEQAFSEKARMKAEIHPAKRASMNSDHLSFDLGVGVCACLRGPRVGSYTGRIHTGRDTVADPQIIEELTDALCLFAENACQ